MHFVVRSSAFEIEYSEFVTILDHILIGTNFGTHVESITIREAVVSWRNTEMIDLNPFGLLRG